MEQIKQHKEKGSAEYINRLNKINVVNLIRHEGQISRAEIVKRTGLSAPTVTRIVDSLINKEGLAVQVGIGESSGGRPPMIVRFNGENNYVIGLDWGRTHIHLVLADLNAAIVADIDEAIDKKRDFEQDIEMVVALVDKLIAKSNIPVSKIAGMGVAAAGYVNQNTGIIEFSPNFGWSKVNIEEALDRSFSFPVKVDNVSRTMALGELWYGLGKAINNFLFVNIGYGIGSGIIVDRKPFIGFDGFSGEIGHSRTPITPVSGENRQCMCGKSNCLECFVSGRGIAETAKQRINECADSKIIDLCNGNIDNITTELLAKAASEGDSFAINIFEEAAEILGLALANFSNAFNPQAIILGGKVSRAGDFFISKIRETFEKETLQHITRNVDIFESSLPGQEAVKGAVAIVLREVLELNIG